jgi:hypothetical protein
VKEDIITEGKNKEGKRIAAGHGWMFRGGRHH